MAVEFVVRVEEALDLLSRDPLAGSGLIGVRAGIPGLRSFPVDCTPYVLFYLAASRRVDLVRVLHGRRDIDAEQCR
jgi:toxin ParE1/3/4